MPAYLTAIRGSWLGVRPHGLVRGSTDGATLVSIRLALGARVTFTKLSEGLRITRVRRADYPKSLAGRPSPKLSSWETHGGESGSCSLSLIKNQPRLRVLPGRATAPVRVN